MNELTRKEVSLRDWVGAFSGALLGILLGNLADESYRTATVMGMIFVGVFLGWYHQEIWSSVRRNREFWRIVFRRVGQRYKDQYYNLPKEAWKDLCALSSSNKAKLCQAVAVVCSTISALVLIHIYSRSLLPVFSALSFGSVESSATVMLTTMIVVTAAQIASALFCWNENWTESDNSGETQLLEQVSATKKSTAQFERVGAFAYFLKYLGIQIGVSVLSLPVLYLGLWSVILLVGILSVLAIWGAVIVGTVEAVLIAFALIMKTIPALASRRNYLPCLAATLGMTFLAQQTLLSLEISTLATWTVAFGTGAISGLCTRMLRPVFAWFVTQTRVGVAITKVDWWLPSRMVMKLCWRTIERLDNATSFKRQALRTSPKPAD